MYKKKCRCGKAEKNFKIDIGPFFIADCCEDAGYDCHGNKANIVLNDPKVLEVLEALGADRSADDEGDLNQDKTLEKMGQKALRSLCTERGIEFKGNDSKITLREKLK